MSDEKRVERFVAFADGSHDPAPDGDWVRYSDYEAAESKLVEVEGDVAKLNGANAIDEILVELASPAQEQPRYTAQDGEKLLGDLEDAIRRAFASGWHSSAPDFDPIDQARVLQDPARMRHLARIQQAAVDVVKPACRGVLIEREKPTPTKEGDGR